MADSHHNSPQSSMHKSKIITVLLIIVPLFIIGFLYLLFVQQQHITTLKGTTRELNTRLAASEQERTFYKEMYWTALDDIRTLSEAYGGDERYEAFATQMRHKELTTMFNITEIPKAIELQEQDLWNKYLLRGVVNRVCLLRPVTMDTFSDETLVSVIASGDNATITAYIDGTLIDSWQPHNGTIHHAAANIPSGVHEITLVSRTAGVQIEHVWLDTKEYPLGNATRDYGAVWSGFDCKNATLGTSLDGPGAIRLLVDKQ